MKNRNKTTKFPVVRISTASRETKTLTYSFRHVPLIWQARIKKIMQKDEEVGKVAQATPIVICTFIPTCLTLCLCPTSPSLSQRKRSNFSFN